MFELRKIGFVKRAAALLLDVILLAVVSTGFIFLISLICNYSHEEKLSTQYYNEWEDYRKEYFGGVAAFYGFTYEESEDGDEYTITKDGEESSFDAIMKTLIASEGKDSETAEAYEAYLTLTPVAKVNAQYKFVYNLLFMMVSIGILLAYIILEFIIPILLKNGQTVGKKVFEICLVRPDCVKITNLSLFARALLGKYAIETMFPILLVFLFIFGGLGILAIILFIAILLLDVVVFITTKNKTPIHDLLASTVVVDKKLQMIYESEEELAQKKALYQNKFLEDNKN